MKRSRSARVGAIAALTAVLLLPTGASAAPPSNDSVLDARSIRSNPITHNLTTAQATRGSTDGVREPRPCGTIGKTVWYRFRLAEGQALKADTFGSNFDTVWRCIGARVRSSHLMSWNSSPATTTCEVLPSPGSRPQWRRATLTMSTFR